MMDYGCCMVFVWLLNGTDYWFLYGCCMVVVWFLVVVWVGAGELYTGQRVNHPVACPCAGRAHGGSRREESSGRLPVASAAVCERAADAAEVG